jgi:hypothetical protein
MQTGKRSQGNRRRDMFRTEHILVDRQRAPKQLPRIRKVAF